MGNKARQITKAKGRLLQRVTNASTSLVFEPQDSTRNLTSVTMTDFGDIGYLAINPKGTAENYAVISFTGWSVSGTQITISGITFLELEGTGTSAASYDFPAGTDVIITDNHQWLNNYVDLGSNQSIDGVKIFTDYPQIADESVVPTDPAEFATVELVNQTAIAGAVRATTITPGISKLSTSAVDPSDPIVVGTNDTRVPPINTSTMTVGQVEALAGTVGTPSSTNEYVTNDDTATTGASVVIRSKANSKIDDSLVGATTAGDTVYSDGTDLQRLAIGSAGQQLVAGPLNAPLYRSSIINLNTTPVTLTNTTVETTLASATLPGNTLGTGGVLRYRLFISDFDDGANDLIFRVKIGATTLITATAGMSGTSDDRNGFIDIFIYANGSASSQYATFSLFASTSGGGTSDFFHLAAAGTATEDTTTNKLISVTGDYTGIGGTDSITISSSVLFYN